MKNEVMLTFLVDEPCIPAYKPNNPIRLQRALLYAQYTADHTNEHVLECALSCELDAAPIIH